MNRKVNLYIAMSVDGYIADELDNLDFLTIVEKEGEDYGYNEFINTIDTVILGRKTFDKVVSMGIEFPHADKEVYIISRTAKPNRGNAIYYTGELSILIKHLKETKGKNIYCDGGAEIVTELLKHNLIDEMILSIIPIILGSGIQLFQAGRPKTPLTLVSTKTFDKGLIQLHYKRI